MNSRSITRPALLCACLFAAPGHAFFPVDAPPAGARRVASSTATAPVERLRTIPDEALKGVMYPADGRIVRINDKVMMLAPGVTIRDMYNRRVLPNTIRNPKKIRYTLDQYGQVRRIWISPTGGYVGRHRFVPPPEPHN